MPKLLQIVLAEIARDLLDKAMVGVVMALLPMAKIINHSNDMSDSSSNKASSSSSSKEIEMVFLARFAAALVLFLVLAPTAARFKTMN